MTFPHHLFDNSVASRAVLCIQRVSADLRKFLFARSLERVRGTVHHDAAHDANEPRSVVITEADIKVHEAMVREFEDDSVTIVAEEGIVEKPDAQYRIVLDDLDGTYNASRGVLGRSAVSCAVDVREDDAWRSVAGIWYNPYFDELVCGEAGRGVRYIRNDEMAKVESVDSPTSLSKSRIIVGTTGATHQPRSKIWNFPLNVLGRRILAPLNYESSVVSLMDVALGRVEGFVIPGNKAWDLWGARTIFLELGIPYAFFTEGWKRRMDDGEVSQFNQDSHLFAFACAANKKLFEEIVKIIQK